MTGGIILGVFTANASAALTVVQIVPKAMAIVFTLAPLAAIAAASFGDFVISGYVVDAKFHCLRSYPDSL